MDIEKVDKYTLLGWYEDLIKCGHYCPCVCSCRKNIPDDIDKSMVKTELIRRLS